MSFQSIRHRVTEHFREKLSRSPVLFFEVGPYLAVSFLVDAFPPVQAHLPRPGGDFVFGLLGGLSVIPVLFPRGRQDGSAGVMKAWGLGLFLAALSLGGVQGFLSGLHESRTFRTTLRVVDPGPWQYFLTLALLSAVLGLAFHRLAAHRQEAERQRELAALAAQAALRAKLAPHFLFNTLNTLHAQIETDPKGAQATTDRLAQLFRRLVAVADQAVIPLKEELAFVEGYLGLEQARLGGRLRVSVEVSEDLEAASIPPLSLQVLVENAIKHGVAPLEEGGEVRIGAGRYDGALHLWVEDPGPGTSAQKGTGTALETLRQRLERPTDLRMEWVEGRHRVSLLWRRP